MLKTKAEVEEWLDTMFIKNYEVRDDLLVTVNDDVYLSGKDLTEIPVNFYLVMGYFDISFNKLKSLDGAPFMVEGIFNCSNNQLTSLEWAPNTVDGTFSCACNNLTTLEHCPETIYGDFDCSNNYLKTLEHLPDTIKGSLICSFNEIETLNNSPKCINGDLDVAHNHLISLDNCPYINNGDLDCRDNKLISLEGITNQHDIRDVMCYDNVELPELFRNNKEPLTVDKIRDYYLKFNLDKAHDIVYRKTQKTKI